MGSVLLVTIPPFAGGVPYKTRILARYLRDLGHRVTVAYYATISDHPDLVARAWQIPLGRRPGIAKGQCFDDFPSVAIGCALPELEFTYYRPSAHWRRVIAAHDRHIAVGGTILVSNPLSLMAIPHLVWCASTMIEDRIDRRRAMALGRRIIDGMVIGPVQAKMEKRILAGCGHFMAVSDYTRTTLLAVGGRQDHFTRLPIPIDMADYRPPVTAAKSGIIGFAGRTGDPRKNMALLFAAVSILGRKGRHVELHLTGESSPHLERLAVRHDISGRLQWRGWFDPEQLPDFFQSLDVFAIASFQEGLNIAGLQAMSCGVPVVSTRCGGPQDYVIDGATGYLCDFTATGLADKLDKIIADRPLRNRLGEAARNKVADDFSFDVFGAQLSSAWHTVWQEQP